MDTEEDHLSLSGVLVEEFESIMQEPVPSEFSQRSFDASPNPKSVSQFYAFVHARAQGRNPVRRSALCLSGGGIRSATFSLGVVQGLAQRGILKEFHYLSTVSGGGYLGGWLSAWINHEDNGIESVQSQLANVRAKAEDETAVPNAEAGAVRHLRRYSNYLAPRAGLFSPDTWTLGALYVRNLLLNWAILLPILVAILMIPRVWYTLMWKVQGLSSNLSDYLLIVLVAIVGGSISWCRPRQVCGAQNLRLRSVLLWVVLPMVITMLTFTLLRSRSVLPLSWQEAAIGAGIAMTVCLTSGWVVSWEHRRTSISNLFSILLSGVVAVLLVCILGYLYHHIENLYHLLPTPAKVRAYSVFSVPVILIFAFMAITIYSGIYSYTSTDEEREWLARLSAWLVALACIWLLLCLISIYVPVYLKTVLNLRLGVDNVIGVLAIVGGPSAVIVAILGTGKKTAGMLANPALAASRRNLLLNVAGFLFIVCILCVIAFITDKWLSWYGEKVAGKDYKFQGRWLGYVIVMAFLTFVAGLVSSWYINVNKFSLHAMYRNRLIRAYLGASRASKKEIKNARLPNAFTGFDPDDNVRMHSLWQRKHIQKRGPFHIINTCLNLAQSEELAWQERKAACFTISPLHCGSPSVGYRRSNEYGTRKHINPNPDNEGITLGTAMAISGAAASPNMGYHTSPFISFLMAMLNVRLGWWLGNPMNNKTYRYESPHVAFKPLVAEALGLTKATSPWIYLSDGGHFDNTGLYEAVVRRCHIIVLSDASADPQCNFTDLGATLRKIRVDLGISIRFHSGHLERFREADISGTKKSWATATIPYKDIDGPGAMDGILLYLKPNLCGNETPDITAYQASDKSFPHQTTSDQFFSESQFESYKALGAHVLNAAFEDLEVSGTEKNSVAGLQDGLPALMQWTLTEIK